MDEVTGAAYRMATGTQIGAAVLNARFVERAILAVGGTGSIAVGTAIAIGLGGREPMREWLQKLGNKAEAEMAKPAAAPVSMPSPTNTP